MRFVDAQTGAPLFSIPPQLSTQSVVATVFDPRSCRLVVLLTNGHLHIWRVSRAAPPKMDDVWTKHAREHLQCLALLPADSVRLPVARADTAAAAAAAAGTTECSEDLLAAGKADGDVVLLSAAAGRLVHRFSAHKLAAVGVVAAAGDAGHLLTASAAAARVWDARRGFVVRRRGSR